VGLIMRLLGMVVDGDFTRDATVDQQYLPSVSGSALSLS
jgi:hypothetical protein